MTNLTDAARDYAEAYKTLHGVYPEISLEAGCATITTATGTCSGFTPKDVRNLSRVLRRLAK